MEQRIQPGFAIGIPARNEESLVGMSIASVLASADALADPTSVQLVVACDSCRDGTVEIAQGLARLDHRLHVIEGTWASAGACRAAAVEHALVAARREASLDDIWVATTDADTVVPTEWLAGHADHWAQGHDAVAGVVELLEDQRVARSVFGRHYLLGPDSHGHVHGANLGVRGDAYVSVGGFPPVDLAEDHALWQALRQAGFTCQSSVALRVATSARLVGRAVGGFADTMRDLMADSLRAPDPAVTT